MPTSCLAKTCSLPVYLMTSSFKTETITLPATHRETSQTPMGRGAKFLCNSIKQQDRKANSTQAFGNIANNLRRSLLYVPELLEARFLCQLSASIWT